MLYVTDTKLNKGSGYATNGNKSSGSALVEDEKDLFFCPTIILNPPLDSEIMKNEIFGPLMPVLVHDFGSTGPGGKDAGSVSSSTVDDKEHRIMKSFNPRKLKEAR